MSSNYFDVDWNPNLSLPKGQEFVLTEVLEGLYEKLELRIKVLRLLNYHSQADDAIQFYLELPRVIEELDTVVDIFDTLEQFTDVWKQFFMTNDNTLHHFIPVAWAEEVKQFLKQFS